MATQKKIERIDINPKKLGGKPTIRGTRIAVEHILSMLGAGMTVEHICDDFPQLTRDDIAAATQYASHLVADFAVYPRAYVTQMHARSAA